MKLELQHLAAYLPYKLNCLVDGQVAEMHSVYSDGSCTFCDIVESEQGFANIYPILRPLSNFVDDDFVKRVMYFVGIENWCEAYDQYFDIWFSDVANVDKLILQAPYVIMQFFLANHYDVFGLIKTGLAVDSKTLPPHDS